MADTPLPGANLEKQALEALKSIGKALGQMGLYKAGHPAVVATLTAAHDNLAAALALATRGEMSIALDRDKLIINGRLAGNLSQLPGAVAQMFNRFKLASITFRVGVAPEELAALCELAAARAESVSDPKAFLSERGVQRIVFNEALYTKAGEKKDGDGQDGSGRGDGALDVGGSGASVANVEEEIRQITDAIAQGSLERTIIALVEKSVPDPVLRRKVIDQVMKLLEQDIAKRVEEVTLPLKREKKSLENERARTAGVLSKMVEGVVVVDEHGKILMMNPAAESIYGSTLAQNAGKGLAERAGDQLVVTMAAELSTPADRDINMSVQQNGAADVQRTVRASSAVIKTEEGKVVGMVSALSDVTKHKELQRMQRDFIAHVTHELRAPLSSIRAALEIIRDEQGDSLESDESRMLNTALKNSDRLADLINSILDFSKLESGQMTVYPKACEAARIAQEAVDSVTPWAQKKNIAVSLTAPGGLPVVSCDAQRTVQILVNLLSNAIKFTPSGGKISVKAAKRAEGNQGFVEYSVTDTGPGIPKSEHNRIFEKFVQISSGELHVGGTGLGLSIAKSLVQLQKGKMWVDSEPGKGSTFAFLLPVHMSGAIEEAVARKDTGTIKHIPWWKKLFGFK